MSTISERATATIETLRPPPAIKPGQIVTEDEVHSALEYLRNSAFALGKAAERERKAEYAIKTREAFGYQMADGASDLRKAKARTSDEYQEALTEHAVAFGELRKLYALREAASLVIDVWRSQEASLRKATKL